MVRGARQLVLGELYLTAPKPETEAALREPARRGRPPKRRKPEPDNHRAPEQGCKQTPVSVHWAEPVVASVESVCFWDRSPVSFGSSVCDRCAAEGPVFRRGQGSRRGASPGGRLPRRGAALPSAGEALARSAARGPPACAAPHRGASSARRAVGMGSGWKSLRGAWSAMQIENPPITRRRTQPNTLPFNK